MEWSFKILLNKLSCVHFKFRALNKEELKKMSEDEGEQVLDKWFEEIAKRTLTINQRKKILAGFKLCTSPLFLKLAFLWHQAETLTG